MRGPHAPRVEEAERHEERGPERGHGGAQRGGDVPQEDHEGSRDQGGDAEDRGLARAASPRALNAHPARAWKLGRLIHKHVTCVCASTRTRKDRDVGIKATNMEATKTGWSWCSGQHCLRMGSRFESQVWTFTRFSGFF